MLFNSIDFLIFFPVVVLIYFIIPRKIKHIWLLVASYYFYMGWNAKYALLLFFSTAVTYLSGIAMDAVGKKGFDEDKTLKYKKLVVAASIILNLGILFLFKYLDFTCDLLSFVFGKAGIRDPVSDGRVRAAGVCSFLPY